MHVRALVAPHAPAAVSGSGWQSVARRLVDLCGGTIESVTMAAVPVPAPADYSALLDYYFRRLPVDATANIAVDVFEGPDFPADDHDVPALFAHTMHYSGQDLLEFSDAQIGIGLGAMFSFSWSDMGYRLSGAKAYLRGDEAIAVDAQCAAIRSVATLYADCLTPRAPALLAHLSGMHGPLSQFCYMLWDDSPLGFWHGAGPADPRVRVLLDVLAEALESSNPACVESALHGLNHLSRDARPAVIELIESLLDRRAQELSAELVSYARKAARGVLQ